MSEEYYAGKDCNCFAKCEGECGCDADWTDPRVYKLRAELQEAKDLLSYTNDYLELIGLNKEHKRDIEQFLEKGSDE